MGDSDHVHGSSKNLPVLLRPQGQGFHAECVLIPNCTAFGGTRDLAIAEIRRVIGVRLESADERRKLPPSYEIIYVPAGGDVLPSSRR